MTRHDDLIRLRHMLEHAREAVELCRERGRVDLERDRMLELSLVRLVEIVGEAATKVSDEFRKKYPFIPWRQAQGMRNRLIHGYDTIDFDVLWDTIKVDFPPLIAGLEKILE